MKVSHVKKIQIYEIQLLLFADHEIHLRLENIDKMSLFQRKQNAIFSLKREK